MGHKGTVNLQDVPRPKPPEALQLLSSKHTGMLTHSLFVTHVVTACQLSADLNAFIYNACIITRVNCMPRVNARWKGSV